MVIILFILLLILSPLLEEARDVGSAGVADGESGGMAEAVRGMEMPAVRAMLKKVAMVMP